MDDKNNSSASGIIKNKDLVLLESHVQGVRSGLCSIVRGFYNVGRLLCEIQKSESYKLKGFKNFYDFTFSAFQLSKTRTSNLVNVYQKFSDKGYESYSFTQLTEMLSLPESDLSKVNSDMTRDQIRDIKKKNNCSAGGTKKEEDKVIKKKDKIEFVEQINAIDAIITSENKKDDFSKSIDQVEGLEVANKILKNKGEKLEIKIENYKKSIIDKDRDIGNLVKKVALKEGVIKDLKIKTEQIELANSRERIRDNEKIQELKNENGNLLSQIADLQDLLKLKDVEIKGLKDTNKLLKEQINEYVEDRKSKRSRTIKKKEESTSTPTK